MNRDQPRKPSGTPAGGQRATMSREEAEVELFNLLTGALVDELDELFEEEAGRCGHCDGRGHVGETTCRSCRGSGRVPTEQDWAAVGVTNQEALAALRDGEYRPEDLTAVCQNMRLGAHIAAGTMVLDGQLLPNAFVLHRHDASVDRRRSFHARVYIVVGDENVRWSSLSAAEQCEHIAGYVAGVCGYITSDQMSSLFEAGYLAGRAAEETAKRIDSGALSEAMVVTSSGCLATATGIEPIGDGHLFYTGFLMASAIMPYEQKAMFARDAVVGPSPVEI